MGVVKLLSPSSGQEILWFGPNHYRLFGDLRASIGQDEKSPRWKIFEDQSTPFGMMESGTRFGVELIKFSPRRNNAVIREASADLLEEEAPIRF